MRKNCFELRQNYRWIAEFFRSRRTSFAQFAAQIAVGDEAFELRCERVRAAGRKEHATCFIHNLGWSAHPEGDHRQRLRERFDENQAEWFGGSIWLAENIGGSHQVR